MNSNLNDCCILNGGSGSWAFDTLAQQLSTALRVSISAQARRFNYLLQVDSLSDDFSQKVFIPISSIHLASDKRLIAETFQRHGVPTPHTVLSDTFGDVIDFVAQHPDIEWCLKFPTGCGANGHRLVNVSSSEPPNWPRPFVLQEFIRLERPEVYRLYCAGGEIFGWVTRRFPAGCAQSPWVAHARGARYERLGGAPTDAVIAARSALKATNLYDSFGCVDLLCRPSGEWVVLEVGTDGLYNHVDRELNDPKLESALLERIAAAFWSQANKL
jgi:glutathione synthase/RimK-type ligase-like ATP-grasp enzyme